MTVPGQLLRTLAIENDDDAHAVAVRALDELPPDEIVYVLAREIEHYRREHARRTETTCFAQMRAGALPSLEELRTGNGDDFRALLLQRFALGDGTVVTWERALVEQHEMRIAMLERMSVGIAQTIARHRQAIELIQEGGGTCLGDVIEA